MNQTLIALAESIIRKSNSERPADAVLREELRKQKGLSRDDGWEISSAVFAYYRWFGWLDPAERLASNIQKAIDLAAQFRSNPSAMRDADLVAKSVPNWIREEMTIAPEFARALQQEPKLWLRARHGESQSVAKGLRYCATHDSKLMPDTLEYSGSVDLFRTPQFHDGLFELQDLASQAVSVICNPQPGETWWDACAGEGGKTLHLSSLMQNKGLIWASDRAEWRLKKLKQRAGRAKVFNYRTALWDGSEKLPTKTKFDGILVDAPCSGVGTWPRNPHARWTTTLNDVRELADIQFQLLSNATKGLKPGGKLIYSVCTLTRSETVDVANRFQAAFPNLVPLSFIDPLQSDKPAQSQLFIWSQDSGGNGMFVAGWRVKA